VSIDWWITLGGLFTGVVVGLTGMGGAAIVTPMLIFVFGVPPAVTVSTDVVSAAAMKPIGAGVHLARRTPHMRIVFWLCIGSVPGVLIGTLIFAKITTISNGADLLKFLVGIALLVSVAVSVLRLRLKWFKTKLALGQVYLSNRFRVLLAVAGFIVGILVGITSVGSGTLIAASLILMFPSMLPSRLVGTDLVQAVPMLIVGAVAHWGLGEIDWTIAASLLIGQIPGIFVGARISSHYNGQALRMLMLVLVGLSGLALVGLPKVATGAITAAGTLIIGTPIVLEYLRERKAEKNAPPVELGGASDAGALADEAKQET
jgi:uncharacterized protein